MKPGLSTLCLLSIAAAGLLTSCATPDSGASAPGTTQYATTSASVRKGPAPKPIDEVPAKKSRPSKWVKARTPKVETEVAIAPAQEPEVARSKRKRAVASNQEATDALDDYGTSAATDVKDPFEGMNRAIFRFNDGLYEFVLRPISKGYEVIAVRPVRQGIDNFFENVKYPVRLVNSGLQGKFKRAGQETSKFLINSVAGVGGIFKPSDTIPSLTDIPAEDTGLTFARWGLGHGPYLVLPVTGPSSLRDGVGLAGDYALNPVNWVVVANGRHARNWTWIPSTANTIRSLPNQLSAYDAARENAVDPYISVRSAYIQNRAAAEKR